MIMKENKQIGFIYKNDESVDKILKDGEVVFERGFLRERTSTTLPINFGGVGKDLKDYRVYGNTVQSKLPSGYTQVDYIHTTNNSYIDTGYKPNANTNIKMKITVSNGTARPFGVLEGNIGYLNSVGYWRIFSTSGQKKEPMGTYDYEIQGNKVYRDGEIIYTGGTPISFNYNLYLFASNVDGTVNYGTNGYLYYFKIYDNNVLVRDFIPCYRNSDNEVGLYDLVNNVFYTNQGTGVFTYGSIAPTPYIPIEMVSCGDNETGLPFGYTQVDFIENSGTQYIDTGFKPNQDTSIEMEVLIPEDSNDITRFFESRNQTSVRESFGIINFKDSNNQIQLRYNTQKGATPGLNTNTKYKITTDKKQLYVDDVLVLTANNATFQVNYNLYLFGFANASSLVNPSVNGTYKLYNFKIYDNDTLIRNFIPCYRNSDNEVGLYDLVTNVFYTNQGTGVFTYGSEIEKGGYKIPININGNITNIYLDEPLRKIGDYADILDFKNSKIVRTINEVILNGTENWVLADIYNNISQFDYSNVLIKKFTTTDNIALFANYFGTTNQWSQSWLKDNIALHRANYNRIRLQTSSITTLEDFKAWLSTHNTIVDYVLATPTEESITLPNIPTVDGNNTLNIETEITPSQVYIKYKSNE